MNMNRGAHNPTKTINPTYKRIFSVTPAIEIYLLNYFTIKIVYKIAKKCMIMRTLMCDFALSDTFVNYVLNFL